MLLIHLKRIEKQLFASLCYLTVAQLCTLVTMGLSIKQNVLPLLVVNGLLFLLAFYLFGVFASAHRKIVERIAEFTKY
jgi:hypothetical protein